MNPEYRAKIYAQKKGRRKLTVKEAVIEAYLKERVENAGGLCLKFIDPGNRGAPDRLVVMPGQPTFYVELKRPKGGVLDGAQIRYHERLRERGQRVWVLKNRSEVDDFMFEVSLL